MASEILTSPLFPLSAHILPGGVMSLRIFEPRYIRMVKEACAQQSGFVICMSNAMGNKTLNQHFYPIGTFVTVEDFDLLEDGLLGITVKGHFCVSIESVKTAKDDLRVGQCHKQQVWTSPEADMEDSNIDLKLEEIFEKYPEVMSLYPKPEFDNTVWVIYRWLELLPVDADQKQAFLKQKDCLPALEFISQLVK
ncbi:MAG: LON peptidase substrate-binding domain-containing protein [Aliiglaciecola sp.]|uniref:LON peptidase substrate-binding domain-containing protein n=1 Tax=Aliiglaciecola sp. TaxID=1872441 RepID=UPI003299290C